MQNERHPLPGNVPENAGTGLKKDVGCGRAKNGVTGMDFTDNRETPFQIENGAFLTDSDGTTSSARFFFFVSKPPDFNGL